MSLVALSATGRSAQEHEADHGTVGCRRRGKEKLRRAREGDCWYEATVTDAIAKAKDGQVDAAQELRRTSWVKAAERCVDATDELLKINRAGADAASTNAEADGAATSAGLVALLAGVVIAVIASFLVAQPWPPPVGQRLGGG